MILSRLIGKALQSGFLKNLSYVSSSKLVTSVFSFLLKIYVVRVLTKEEFGTVTILLSLYVYICSLADLSVFTVVQKDIVGDKDNYWDKYNLFANSKIYTVSASIIIFFAAAYLMGYKEYYLYVAILSLSVLFDAVYRMPEILLLSFDKYKLFSKLTVFTNLFFTLLQGVLIFLFKSIFAYFLAMLIHLIICAAAYYYFTGKEFPDIYKFKLLGKERVIRLLKKALPLSIGSFLYLIFYRVDIFFIERYLGKSKAAEYGLSFSILDQFIYLIFAQFLIVLYPRLIAFYNEDIAKLRRTIQYFNFIFASSFAALTALSAILAEPVIVFVFGKTYAYSAILLTYMVPNLCLAGFWHFYSRVMIITSRETIYFVIMIIGFILKIVLSYTWIALYGAPGIIASTFVVFLLVIISYYIISDRAIKRRALL